MKGTIKDTLSKIGLSEKEIEVYIFLGKSEPKKGLEIAKHLKMNKGQVYRLLKGLQKKGVVETTLESPTRFISVPFETIIDLFIKSKRDEVNRIEETKEELLDDWKNIRKISFDSSFEKFSVIEGNKKILNKLLRMVDETKQSFALVAHVRDLLSIERQGFFDSLNCAVTKSNAKIRVLFPLSEPNLKHIKRLKARIKPVIGFKGKNPNFGLQKFPRMAIRDDEEIILFISDKGKEPSKNGEESCLSTNCKTIVESFSSAFDNTWKYAIDVEDWMDVIENRKTPVRTQIIREPEVARNLYNDVLDSAKEELFIVTSSNGLIGLFNEKARLIDWNKRGIAIKIMAPIIGENLKVAQELSNFSEVRHVSRGYLETTIIDGEHLFQFKNPPIHDKNITAIKNYENTFYTSDRDYVEKNANMLDDIWMNAFSPSTITLKSISRIDDSQVLSETKVTEETKKISGLDFVKDEKTLKKRAEKTLQDKFITGKRVKVADLSRDIVVDYAVAGQAVIHPPKHFNLPHLLFHIMQMNKPSSFGAEDAMVIMSRQKTPNGYLYVPASFITDNSDALVFWKKFFEGLPLEQNLVKEEEFHIQIQGNILFAGWTIPIQLPHQNHILPPSCIMIERYGNVKTAKYTVGNPSGYAVTNEVNYFNAFVTYMHPQSRYSGPGTDGYFYREFYSTTYPPQRQKQ